MVARSEFNITPCAILFKLIIVRYSPKPFQFPLRNLLEELNLRGTSFSVKEKTVMVLVFSFHSIDFLLCSEVFIESGVCPWHILENIISLFNFLPVLDFFHIACLRNLKLIIFHVVVWYILYWVVIAVSHLY